MDYKLDSNYDHDDMTITLSGGMDIIKIQQQMRIGFIKKVFGLLSVQLLITSIFTGLALMSKSLTSFLLSHSGLMFFMLILTVVLPFVIICFPQLMHQVPQNYILLLIFTIAESYIVAYISCLTKPSIVFMAAVMTFCMVLALTIYALTTKTDFTMQGGLLFLFSCGILLLSIFCLFTSNKFFYILVCTLGIILYGLYLIYDIQLIIGKGKVSVEEDDYILGAFMLYTDIIYLFLEILRLLKILDS